MKLLNVALIAGGGYFVLRYLGIDPLAGITDMFSGVSTTPSTPVTPVTTTPQANGPITPNMKSLLANRIAEMGTPADSLQSVDIWNYVYNDLRGISGPSPEALFPNNDRNTKYTLDEYWSAMSAKGFSGLYSYHGMQGMGLVARMNPWINHYTPGPGRTILPLGSETFVRRFGVN